MNEYKIGTKIYSKNETQMWLLVSLIIQDKITNFFFSKNKPFVRLGGEASTLFSPPCMHLSVFVWKVNFDFWNLRKMLITRTLMASMRTSV